MSRYSSSYYGFAPYVSVATRRANAAKEIAKLAKAGKTIIPVQITGKKISTSFWGNAWCDNLEAYSDYANRIPRGRTYVRNGSVVHLGIRKGEIEALVSGSSLYKITIEITPVAKTKWQTLCQDCSGGIGSLVELLQGRLSSSVMEVITRRDSGLFPSPKEIKLKCSCPDSAGLCKHLAAVLYGIGSRLDNQPELLFVLRSADSADLISHAANASTLTSTAADGPGLADDDIGAIFGIDMEQSPIKPTLARKTGKKKTTIPKSRTSKPATAAKKSTSKNGSSVTAKKITTQSTPAKKKLAKKTVTKKTAAKKAPRKLGSRSKPQ